VTRLAPAILELLGDGLPRSRHEVVRTLMRLAVTGRLVEAERKYTLPPPSEPGRG
jgi:hypothetical protein